ncbi:MerR family transcriptional regulator [Chengkuizengella axinellae]|uniref:MerR family transcriptional regulator n=1 Tax=Chengkuizengella axinellae TaxID=3064388 RepID=A0ABT9J4V1_9BACL|nr:MerR family transcriptional regulator [Chengkuizengella sp. 2205SS18-9]MDP5276603.1 MerR family transcriptional regulator [Chengkuizengella sp. 2205SS18-9]
MMYKVKEVSTMVGVSVRTLHHYDRIGLLEPETTTPAGYRLYTDHNLERLQQILFFKEMDFSLQEIKEILDQPDFDRKKTLQTHKEVLVKKKKRIEKMIKTVDYTLVSIEGGIKMENKEMFNGFDMKEIEKHQQKYAEEAKQKFGEAYNKTVEKTKNYTEEDWKNITEEANGIYAKLASRMEFGAEDEQAQEAIHEWRQHITKYFYECTIDTFKGLGEMYVADERFTKNIDKHKKGLAQFMKDTMYIYCDSHSK